MRKDLFYSIRKNGMILSATFGTIIVISAVLWYFDFRLSQEKNAYIIAHANDFFYEIHQQYSAMLTSLVEEILYSENKTKTQAYLDLEKLFQKIVNNTANIIYKMELLVSADGEEKVQLRYENYQKFRKLNNYKNSFISRKFSRLTQVRIGSNKLQARLIAYYSSPQGVIEIEQKIKKYWLYSSLFTVGVLMIYTVWMKFYLLPVRNVLSKLELVASGQVKIINNPKTLIETAYNKMIEWHKKLVEQEKNIVSINLARNLGHDLTNIIASARCDLDTLNSLLNELESSLKTEMNNYDKMLMFRETVSSLMYNTAFLQEIVDIYRSFSYLGKPIYQQTDLNDLLKRLVALFRLTTSARIKFIEKLSPNLPAFVVESRLLKLAIFNLINNSVEAVKTAFSVGYIPENEDGKISIISEWDGVNKSIILKVEDNGCGIRDKETGRLLSEEETAKLFEFDYTTKEKETGGGLGLAWVKTIICEYHQGKVLARNNSQGGATFTIILPELSSTRFGKS